MKNGGGHFAPELGGHFELESGGHFKLELGGQYDWNLQLQTKKKLIAKNGILLANRVSYLVFIANFYYFFFLLKYFEKFFF